MPKLNVEVVSAERVVFAGEADMVVAPGSEGVLGILPRHASLLSMLAPGVLRIKQGDDEVVMAVDGGFLQVNNNRVEVLTDVADRAEEIDLQQAQEARRRAEQALADMPRGQRADAEAVEAALRRSLVRLKVAELRRRRGQQR
jgi:F-type H+-transporting ATPase subunit epsilon